MFSKKNAKNRPPSLQPRCKPCAAQDTREYNIQNKEKVRDSRYTKTYGLRFKEVIEMSQGQCEICKIDLIFGASQPNSQSGVVDHNHTTGRVRGILCNSCNRGIGYFRDNPMFLEKAASYLREKDQISQGGQ